MTTAITVTTLKELKAALAEKPDAIEIADPTLAMQVRVIKTASVPAVTAAVAALGVGAAMAWNPVGWGVMGAAVTAQGALVAAVAFLVAALGVAVLWGLVNDWEIDVGAEVAQSVDVKGGVKHSAKGNIKLRPSGKKASR